MKYGNTARNRFFILVAIKGGSYLNCNAMVKHIVVTRVRQSWNRKIAKGLRDTYRNQKTDDSE